LPGDLGAVASVTIFPYVPPPSLQPISSIALNGRSEIAFMPDGSFEPDGGGGGGAAIDESATVTVALPVTSNRVAVICAAPGACARTTPADDTVATDGALELHTTGFVTCELFLLKRVAVACVVCANASELEASVTFTTATIASGVVALSSIGSVALRSEHERTPISARAIAASLKDVRFIFWPLHRTTCFSRVSRNSAMVQVASCTTGGDFETGNTSGRRAFG
jgi:hypothetical protein